MGLANRIVGNGEALAAAQALAHEIAAFPQACMLADRQSAYRQWDLPLAEALRQEGARGVAIVSARASPARRVSSKAPGGTARSRRVILAMLRRLDSRPGSCAPARWRRKALRRLARRARRSAGRR